MLACHEPMWLCEKNPAGVGPPRRLQVIVEHQCKYTCGTSDDDRRSVKFGHEIHIVFLNVCGTGRSENPPARLRAQHGRGRDHPDHEGKHAHQHGGGLGWTRKSVQHRCPREPQRPALGAPALAASHDRSDGLVPAPGAHCRADRGVRGEGTRECGAEQQRIGDEEQQAADGECGRSRLGSPIINQREIGPTRCNTGHTHGRQHERGKHPERARALNRGELEPRAPGHAAALNRPPERKDGEQDGQRVDESDHDQEMHPEFRPELCPGLQRPFCQATDRIGWIALTHFPPVGLVVGTRRGEDIAPSPLPERG